MLRGCQLTGQQLPCSRLQLITICSTLKYLCTYCMLCSASPSSKTGTVKSVVMSQERSFPDGPFHSSYELLTVCLKLNNHHASFTFTHTILQSIKQTLPVIQMQVTELSPAVIFTISGWEPQPRLQGAPASNSKLTSMQIQSILFARHMTTASACFPSQVPAHILMCQHVLSTWSSPRVQAQTLSPRRLCIKFQAHEDEILVQSFSPGKWQLRQHASNHTSLHTSSRRKSSAHDLLHNCWHEHRLLAYGDQGGPFCIEFQAHEHVIPVQSSFSRHMKTTSACFQSPGLRAHLHMSRGLSTWSSPPLQARTPAPYAWRPRNTEQTEHHHSQSQTHSPCPTLPPSQTHNVHISTRKSNMRPGREAQVHLSLHSTSGCSHHSSSRPTSPTRLSHSHPLPSSHRPQTRSHHHSSLHRLLPRRSSPRIPSSSLS